MSNAQGQLDRLSLIQAVRQYRQEGRTWAAFWQDHREAIRRLAPDRENFRRLRDELMDMLLLGVPA